MKKALTNATNIHLNPGCQDNGVERSVYIHIERLKGLNLTITVYCDREILNSYSWSESYFINAHSDIILRSWRGRGRGRGRGRERGKEGGRGRGRERGKEVGREGGREKQQ